MKKIIILLLILIPKITYAKVFYTDYEPLYSQLESKLTPNDTLLEQDYKLYNTFEYQEISSEYARLNENSLNNPYLDETDYQEKEVYLKEYQSNLSQYETICQNKNFKTRKIVLSNFLRPLTLTEHKIIYKGKSLPHGYDATKAHGAIPHLGDKIEDTGEVTISEDGTLFFVFFEDISLEDLQINLISNQQDPELNSFDINFEQEKLHVNVSQSMPDKNIISLTFKNDYSQILQEKELEVEETCTSFYSGKEKFYKYYNLGKNYLNVYLNENSENIDLSNYKVFYDYSKREKIILKEPIEINNEFAIKDFVEYSSIPLENFTFKNNINYNETGTYLLEIFYKNKLIGTSNIYYNKPETILNETVVTPTVNSINKSTIKNNNDISKNNNQKTTTNILKNQTISTNKVKTPKPFFIKIIKPAIITFIIFLLLLLYVNKKYNKD